jgi:hypothetical protein
MVVIPRGKKPSRIQLTTVLVLYASSRCAATSRTLIFKRSNGFWVINGKTWLNGDKDQTGRIEVGLNVFP